MEHEGVIHNANLPPKLKIVIFGLMRGPTSSGFASEEVAEDYESAEIIAVTSTDASVGCRISTSIPPGSEWWYYCLPQDELGSCCCFCNFAGNYSCLLQSAYSTCLKRALTLLELGRTVRLLKASVSIDT
jgi:hypothetical protein